VPDSLPPFLGFLSGHLHAVVFVVAIIDATGIPFPGRVLIVAAGALAGRNTDLIPLVLATAAGAVVGDHVVYALGRLGGDKMLVIYRRWTRTSERRMTEARKQFARFGPAAIIVGRFAFSIRLMASLLAGSGAMSYPQFLLFDVLGGLVWAAVLVLLGWLLGAPAVAALEAYGSAGVLAVVALTGVAGVLAAWLWQRRRHRAAPAAG
jgi:membrane protein DedA with SNARE-associated domain